MGKTSQRLGQQDWILAAFRALAVKGPSGIRVEPLARDLGTTKGSFYWHFADLAALCQAMLIYWEARALHAILAALDPLPPGQPRLRHLITLAAGSHQPGYGGAAAEPALRDWMRYDSVVRAAVERVDAARIAYLEGCFADAGRPDPGLARLFYGAWIGLEVLSVQDGQTGEAMLHGLLDTLIGPLPRR